MKKWCIATLILLIANISYAFLPNPSPLQSRISTKSSIKAKHHHNDVIKLYQSNDDTMETTSSNNKPSSSSSSILDNMLQFRKNFSIAASDGFGTKARNVASTMSVGDIVVPLCGNLAIRQILANQGIYPGVEYEVCTLQVNGQDISTIQGLSKSDKTKVVATMKPAYKLRDYLERSDWPVSVKPFEDVPLWLSKATYEAGTMVGTLGLSLTYLSIAAFLAFFVRFTYVRIFMYCCIPCFLS